MKRFVMVLKRIVRLQEFDVRRFWMESAMQLRVVREFDRRGISFENKTEFEHAVLATKSNEWHVSVTKISFDRFSGVQKAGMDRVRGEGTARFIGY